MNNFEDGFVSFGRLTCQGPLGRELRFEDTGYGIRVRLGASESQISREEIAALAALWPVKPRRDPTPTPFPPASGQAQATWPLRWVFVGVLSILTACSFLVGYFTKS